MYWSGRSRARVGAASFARNTRDSSPTLFRKRTDAREQEFALAFVGDRKVREDFKNSRRHGILLMKVPLKRSNGNLKKNEAVKDVVRSMTVALNQVSQNSFQSVGPVLSFVDDNR
jgi:hypothetical protein